VETGGGAPLEEADSTRAISIMDGEGCAMTAVLRWQQAEGKRHAVKLVDELPPVPGIPFRTLCMKDVTADRHDFTDLGGIWLDPTCVECETAWRRMRVTATGMLL
jgi:hypothetical protein